MIIEELDYGEASMPWSCARGICVPFDQQYTLSRAGSRARYQAGLGTHVGHAVALKSTNLVHHWGRRRRTYHQVNLTYVQSPTFTRRQ